jgi:VCBS repeat-containing protein
MTAVAVDDVAADILSIGGTTVTGGAVVANDSGASLLVGGFRPGTESGSGTFTNYFTGPIPAILPGTLLSVTGTYGTLMISVTGAWLYTLDVADLDTLGLAKDQIASDVFTYRVHDGDIDPPDFAQLTINIKGINTAPVITSNGGGATAKVSIHEGDKAVTMVKATDAESTPLTYAIAGGADAARFKIDAATGKLSFKSAPDFTSPTDAGRNNIYDVIVSASDGAAMDTQALEVQVKDVGASIVGGNGIDIVTAGPFGRATGGDDRLSGRGGFDWLAGGKGNDTIDGGAGSDVIKGGRGNDDLRGGKGADFFVFADKGAAHADTIEDFRHNQDVLVLHSLSFGLPWGSLSNRAFHAADGATKAHDSSDRIIYDMQTGKLFYDADGNRAGGAGAVHFATLEGRPTLDAGDFLIV